MFPPALRTARGERCVFDARRAKLERAARCSVLARGGRPARPVLRYSSRYSAGDVNGLPLHARAGHKATIMERAAVLWDMDGVLVDSSEAHYEAWRRLAETLGVTLTREAFRPSFGMTNPDAIRAIFGAVPNDEARRMASWKEDAFRRLLRGRVQPLPGAEALVRALSQAGHRQAVATSAPCENIAALF